MFGKRSSFYLMGIWRKLNELHITIITPERYYDISDLKIMCDPL